MKKVMPPTRIESMKFIIIGGMIFNEMSNETHNTLSLSLPILYKLNRLHEFLELILTIFANSYLPIAGLNIKRGNSAPKSVATCSAMAFVYAYVLGHSPSNLKITRIL